MNDTADIAQYAVAKAVEFMDQKNIPLADEQKFAMAVGFMFGLMYAQAMKDEAT